MKKLLTVMLTALMVLTSGVSVFAGEADTKNTNVTYSVEAGYEWTQPASLDGIAFDDTDGGHVKSGNVEVTKAVIAGDQVLNIYINGDAEGEFKIVSSEGAELTYEVKKGTDSVSAGDKVLSIVAGTDLADESNPGLQALSFELTDETAGDIAGTFTGICTFEAKLEAAN